MKIPLFNPCNKKCAYRERNSVLLQIVMQLKDTETEGEKGRKKNLNQNGLKASLVFNGISPEGVCSENSLCGAY